MFWLEDRKKINETNAIVRNIYARMNALEEYLDIKYCHGMNRKPYYRKNKEVKRPVGRPRKIK